MSYGDDYEDPRARRAPAQTRTRLPEDEEATPRQTASAKRSLATIVAVVVLLLAAIVFANQTGGDGDGDGTDDQSDGQTQPTAPTGERPVDDATNGIPSGFAQTEQGAESAAANFSVALGGEGMFNPDERQAIVDAISSSSSRDELQSSFAGDYTAELNDSIGLDAEGAVTEDSHTFVNRTVPIGTSVQSYEDTTAEVSVWCSGLFGMAGLDSQTPVRTSWFTVHFTMVWEDADWKVVSTDQTEGPTPVNGDNRVSGSEEIAEAVEEYGGFTYAR